MHKDFSQAAGAVRPALAPRRAAETLYDTTQAAAYLGLAPETLATWRCTQRQQLAFVKIGGRVRYRLSDLQAFIERNVNCAGAEADA